MRRSYRSWTTALGTWSGSVAAGVPARIEYWKVNALENRAARTTSSVPWEVGLGLAREADDDVGGDRRVGDSSTDPSMIPRNFALR